MPDPDQTSGTPAEQANAEEIKWEENAQHGPRGNVHSEPDGEDVEQDMPPPMPG